MAGHRLRERKPDAGEVRRIGTHEGQMRKVEPLASRVTSGST